MTEPAAPRVGGSAPNASGADHASAGASGGRGSAAAAPSAEDASYGGSVADDVAPNLPTRTGGGARGPRSHNCGLVAGWVLYALSWVTPSLDARQFGATAFVDSVRLAWHFLGTGSLLPGLCVTLGWLANFSVFLRLPCWLRIVAIVAPWLAFAVVLAKVPARATFFLYFYPWALGIALIHTARCSSRKAAN